MLVMPFPSAIRLSFSCRTPKLTQVLSNRIHRAGNYWVVNQIISKGLHTANAETTQFTTDLMDKLERVCTVATTLARTRAFMLTLSVCQKFKEENPDNDAIKDNVAGQAYIEQFGQEVFSRADNAVRANKASKYAYILRLYSALVASSLTARRKKNGFNTDKEKSIF